MQNVTRLSTHFQSRKIKSRRHSTPPSAPREGKGGKEKAGGGGWKAESNGTLTRVTFEASLRRKRRHRRQRLQGAQSSLNPRLLELRSPEGINQVQSHSFAGERGCRLDPTNTEPEPRHWESGSQPNPQRALCLLITPNNVMKCKSKATPGGAPERRESCIFAHQPVLPKNHKVTTASRFHSPYTPWPEIPSRRTVSSHTRPYTKSIFT